MQDVLKPKLVTPKSRAFVVISVTTTTTANKSSPNGEGFWEEKGRSGSLEKWVSCQTICDQMSQSKSTVLIDKADELPSSELNLVSHYQFSMASKSMTFSSCCFELSSSLEALDLTAC